MPIEYSPLGSESGVARQSSQGSDWRRTYTQHWRAITDDPAIGAAEVRINAPVAIGQIYQTATESDAGSFCQQVAAVEDTQANDGCQWIVTAEYGPYDVLSQSPELPMTQRPKLSFGWAEFQVPQLKSALGNPIANSAGDAYNDPPLMMDDAWPLMMITRNEAGYSLPLVAQCKNRVNNAPWFGFPAKWWKCVNITADEALDPNGAIYFVVTYEFALNPNEWIAELPDWGLREIKANGDKVAILDRYGAKVTSPWPLNQDGTKKAPGEELEFIEFEVHEAIDFGIFNLDTFYAEEVTAGRLVA